jgi:hypothetical protein
VKRTTLKRNKELRADPLKTLEWHRKSRKALGSVSAKRRADLGARAMVRQAVIERAGGQCEYAAVIPEVRCGFVPGRGMEVDEIRGGSYRVSEWLDPDRCKLTCPVHHDFKTNHKRLVLDRLRSRS